MSYILEALKKSEQERGHGTAPGIQSVHSSGLRYNTSRRPLWPYILTAAVIVNLAVLVYFIAGDRGPPAAVGEIRAATVATTPAETETMPKPAAAAADAEPAAVVDEPQRTGAAPIAPMPNASEAETGRSARPASGGTTNDGMDAATADTAYAQAYTPSRNELPVEIERQIPVMEFSAHVYSSNPAQRSIMINGRFLEEGDMLATDLVLSEITPNGAIFDFRGYRFSQGVVSAWN